MNTSLVPNYADIIGELKDQPWNTVDGVNYGIPHGRGANLLLYPTAEYPTAPDSWADMFEADSPAKGKVVPYDDAIYIADAAVYLMATQPDLGIKNPYALDQAQFDAAIALLEQQKPLVAYYWGDLVKQGQDLASGTVMQSQGWQLTANYTNADHAGRGGHGQAQGGHDRLVGHLDGQEGHREHQLLLPLAGLHRLARGPAQIAEYFGEAPANAKSCALTKNADHCADFHAEETSYWDDVWYWTTPTEECLDGRTDVKCVTYDQWVQAWSKLTQRLIAVASRSGPAGTDPRPARPRSRGRAGRAPGRTTMTTTTASATRRAGHPGPVRRVQAAAAPAARRRVAGLLAPPMAWMLLVYLAPAGAAVRHRLLDHRLVHRAGGPRTSRWRTSRRSSPSPPTCGWCCARSASRPR